MKCFQILILSVLAVLVTTNSLTAQTDEFDFIGREGEANTITTTVPFLMIAPDTRAGSMGDAGVATTPDANSMHWNAAKYAFVEDDMGVSLTYTPWLRKLVNDMNLGYLSGYYRMSDENVLAATLLYFDMGTIDERDINNQPIRQSHPHEFALDFAYSRLLGRNFSGSVALRYIHSYLTSTTINGLESKPGRAVAADVGFFYTNDMMGIKNMPGTFNWGLNISNLGNKMSYTNNENLDFIPANFRTGVYYGLQLDQYNELAATIDFNKLLVPTPPTYEDGEVVEGTDPADVSVPAAIFNSWADAPGTNFGGSVFKEELAEIQYSLGLEYWYDKKFALRAGYFHEHQQKGNRKFFSIGAGLKLNVFGLDFGYLIPTQNFGTHPLTNVLRVTINWDLGAMNAEENI